MKFIFCALELEAKPLAESLSLVKLQDSPFLMYADSETVLTISGIGSINIALCVGYIYARYKEHIDKNTIFINFGTTSSQDLNIGDIYIINKVGKDGEKRSFYPDIFYRIDTPFATLQSIDTPLNKDSDTKKGILYDMEGFAFVLAVNRFLQTHQYQLIKIVSDNKCDAFFSKKAVADMISKHIEVIKRFLDSLEVDLEILTSTEKHLIYLFLERLRFSFTQKEELKKLFYGYKLRDKSITKFLKIYDNILPKNKSDRNKIFKDVRQSLVTA